MKGFCLIIYRQIILIYVPKLKMGRKETARAHRLLYRKRKSNIKQFKKGIPRHTPFHLRREERRTRTKNRSDLLAPEIEQQKIESGIGRHEYHTHICRWPSRMGKRKHACMNKKAAAFQRRRTSTHYLSFSAK